MPNFSEELREKLAQVYCLPKHSHKVLDPELLEDISIAITELVKKIVPEEKKAGYIDSPEAIQYNNESFYKTEGFNSCRTEMLKKLT